MRSFFRAIRDGFKGVFRHGGMSVSAASAVTITLIIISAFTIFTANVRQFTQGLEQSVQISVMVDYNYESAEEESRIETSISSIPGVTQVTYSSKDQEFQYYLNSFSDEKTREAFEPFDGDENPMHDAYYVEVSDGTQLESIASQIQQIEGVSSVNFGGTSATRLVSVLRTVRYAGLILALALSILAVYLVQNTIKLTIMARRNEIAIMRNVGAKNGYIRGPFVVEGAVIGALGSIIPIVLTYFAYTYLYEHTGGYVISEMFSLIPPEPAFLPAVYLMLLLVGMIVGLIGSFFSVSRYLRWKR